jgi:hypothetical protein
LGIRKNTMGKIGNYIHQILSESNGTPSSKRWIVMICTILMAVGFIGNEFFGKTIDPNIFNSIMFVVIGGMGITGAEKFAPNNNNSN